MVLSISPHLDYRPPPFQIRAYMYFHSNPSKQLPPGTTLDISQKIIIFAPSKVTSLDHSVRPGSQKKPDTVTRLDQSQKHDPEAARVATEWLLQEETVRESAEDR